MLLLTPAGVERSRSVKRQEDALQWKADVLSKVKGSPWNPAGAEARETLAAGPSLIAHRDRRMYIT